MTIYDKADVIRVMNDLRLAKDMSEAAPLVLSKVRRGKISPIEDLSAVSARQLQLSTWLVVSEIESVTQYAVTLYVKSPNHMPSFKGLKLVVSYDDYMSAVEELNAEQ